MKPAGTLVRCTRTFRSLAHPEKDYGTKGKVYTVGRQPWFTPELVEQLDALEYVWLQEVGEYVNAERFSDLGTA